MPFKKGQSGNPSGRPKIWLNVNEAYRSDALKDLAKTIAKTKKEHFLRYLDYAFGKPAETVNATVTEYPGLDQETINELRALAKWSAEVSKLTRNGHGNGGGHKTPARQSKSLISNS